MNRERGSRAIYQEIKTAYRSSPEIVAYCNEILGTNIVSVRDSQGIAVEEKISKSVDTFLSQLKNDIDRIISDGFLRIAIITDSAEQASLLLNSFEKYKDIKSIDFQILPFYKAKGLEFDAVVAIYDFERSGDYINSTVLGKEIAVDDRMLYIACTRAQHKLIVYYNPSQSFLDIVSLFLNYFNVYHKRFRLKLF